MNYVTNNINLNGKNSNYQSTKSHVDAPFYIKKKIDFCFELSIHPTLTKSDLFLFLTLN